MKYNPKVVNKSTKNNILKAYNIQAYIACTNFDYEMRIFLFLLTLHLL